MHKKNSLNSSSVYVLMCTVCLWSHVAKPVPHGTLRLAIATLNSSSVHADVYSVSVVTRSNSVAPPLLSSITLGGFTGNFFFLLKSLLRPLATHIPSLGRVGQCAWELGLPQIRKCHFVSDPCVFGYIF